MEMATRQTTPSLNLHQFLPFLPQVAARMRDFNARDRLRRVNLCIQAHKQLRALLPVSLERPR